MGSFVIPFFVQFAVPKFDWPVNSTTGVCLVVLCVGAYCLFAMNENFAIGGAFLGVKIDFSTKKRFVTRLGSFLAS